MIYAIIAAGGTGSRFGGDIPKQFTQLKGRTILEQTTEKFLEIDEISEVIIACHKDWVEYAKGLYKDCSNVRIIEGGSDRNKTVMNAVDCIAEIHGLDDETIIVTHDAVRPFVDKKVILESIEKTFIHGAAVAAVEAVDTIIEVDNGFVTKVPDRSRMWQVQTPQTFKAKKLRDLYNSLSEDEKSVLTDCSRIFVTKKEKVALVRSNRDNIKITFREDLNK